MYIPANYEQINLATAHYAPSSLKLVDNRAFSYWERSLFQRACSVIELQVPEAWRGNTKDFLYYCLFKYGYIAVFYSEKYGFSFQPCALSGYDFYYQPTTAIISNPSYSANLKIGSECELMKLTPDYMGIWDIIAYYAEKLALLDGAITVSLVNQKFAYLIGANSKSAAETLKKAFDKINKGEPAAIFDMYILKDKKDDEPFTFIDRDLEGSYLSDKQLTDLQTLLNNFDAEVGIPTIPYAKKERMVTTEAESRVMDSTARSVIWYNTLLDSIHKINGMFGTNLSVALRYPQEVKDDESEQVNYYRVK